ncbi:hypothetical protein [Lentzea sp.]|uniref:hypothetical protein n=1 Tax=Lentzea sp. TaxID=56099 RepID=UPI002C5D17E1|nr:hypothetical protein [Lentzea sp.]HUQ54155.1 hypothetical protein [Lentzea sp.]
MRRTLIALTAVMTLAGCTAEPPPPPAPSTTTSVPGSLADEWDEKFDAALRTPQPCGPTTARTQDCADWLTIQVEVVSALSAAIRARDDSSRYSRTLAGIVKVFQSREAYEECDDDCWNHAWQVNLGTLAVRTTLRADDQAR